MTFMSNTTYNIKGFDLTGMGLGSCGFGGFGMSGIGGFGMDWMNLGGFYDTSAMMGWGVANSIFNIGGGIACAAIQAHKTQKAAETKELKEQDNIKTKISDIDTEIAELQKRVENPEKYIDKKYQKSIDEVSRSLTNKNDELSKLNTKIDTTIPNDIATLEKTIANDKKAGKSTTANETKLEALKTQLKQFIDTDKPALEREIRELEQKKTAAEQAKEDAIKELKEDAQEKLDAKQAEKTELKNELNNKIESRYAKDLELSSKCDSEGEFNNKVKFDGGKVVGGASKENVKDLKRAFNYAYRQYYNGSGNEKTDYAMKAVAIYEAISEGCPDKLDATMDGAYKNMKAFIKK